MMFSRWTVPAGVALTCALGFAPYARANTQPPAPSCSALTKTYHIRAVEPYKVADHVVPTDETNPKLRGVSFQVAAQPGLTRQWLRRSLEEKLASGACNLGVSDLKVDVQPAGDAFQVHLTTPDERAARDLLKNVQQLAR